MGRLINADWFKSVMLDEPTEWMTEEQLVQFRAMVNLAPTVDAVPARHGRWIWRNYPGYQYQCDQCKRWAMYESKFCPECGALMKWWKDGDNHG